MFQKDIVSKSICSENVVGQHPKPFRDVVGANPRGHELYLCSNGPRTYVPKVPPDLRTNGPTVRGPTYQSHNLHEVQPCSQQGAAFPGLVSPEDSRPCSTQSSLPYFPTILPEDKHNIKNVCKIRQYMHRQRLKRARHIAQLLYIEK